MNYISVIESGTGDDSPRVSTLEVTDKGLCVLGNLPHGYTFKPLTAADRGALCNYLQSLNFEPDNMPCELCAASLTGYLPGCKRCDKCTDKHGLESTGLNAALIDITKGL